MLTQKGTTIELWRTAVVLFPDIVDAYGEFSGELLQAMLGIPFIAEVDKPTKSSGNVTTTTMMDNSNISDEPSSPKADKTDGMDYYENSSNNLTKRPSKRGIFGGGGSKSSMPRSTSKLRFEKVYTKLAPETQAIIFAGKLGQPVRCISTKSTSFHDHDGEAPIEEDAGYLSTDSNRYITFKKSQDSESSTTFSTTDAMAKHAAETTFEVDNTAKDHEENTDLGNASMLLEPNASLIRSMRRCERKLPPILNHWAIVDVVMTEYEIVYFDAMGVDEHDSIHPFLPKVAGAKHDAVRDALVATKGGKKLRLRDVTAGRKIVGHVDVRKIDSVKVLRHSPTASPEEGEDVYRIQSEYWKSSGQLSSDPFLVKEGNRKRWERSQEDNLQIHSAQGVLYLRFFSDLDTYEAKVGTLEIVAGKDSSEEPLALLWAQTIGRLCGTHQLKQDLPHFGQERSVAFCCTVLHMLLLFCFHHSHNLILKCFLSINSTEHWSLLTMWKIAVVQGKVATTQTIRIGPD
jgi:hypothetical protein